MYVPGIRFDQFVETDSVCEKIFVRKQEITPREESPRGCFYEAWYEFISKRVYGRDSDRTGISFRILYIRNHGGIERAEHLAGGSDFDDQFNVGGAVCRYDCYGQRGKPD